jgi:hypothetical protein
LAKEKVNSNGGQEAVAPNKVLYLSLGAVLPQLDIALEHMKGRSKFDGDGGGGAGDERMFEYAYIDKLEALPRQWYAYQGVDVIVLTTKDTDLVNALNRPEGLERRNALTEWVRRGGKLVISISGEPTMGSRAQLVKNLNLLELSLDEKKVGWSELEPVRQWVSSTQEGKPPIFNRFGNNDGRKVEVARVNLNPRALRKPGVVVANPDAVEVADQDKLPLIVQAPCDLGRVMLVAFGLNEEPFTSWAGQ